jgi:hypothetical protein
MNAASYVGEAPAGKAEVAWALSTSYYRISFLSPYKKPQDRWGAPDENCFTQCHSGETGVLWCRF